MFNWLLKFVRRPQPVPIEPSHLHTGWLYYSVILGWLIFLVSVAVLYILRPYIIKRFIKWIEDDGKTNEGYAIKNAEKELQKACDIVDLVEKTNIRKRNVEPSKSDETMNRRNRIGKAGLIRQKSLDLGARPSHSSLSSTTSSKSRHPLEINEDFLQNSKIVYPYGNIYSPRGEDIICLLTPHEGSIELLNREAHNKDKKSSGDACNNVVKKHKKKLNNEINQTTEIDVAEIKILNTDPRAFERSLSFGNGQANLETKEHHNSKEDDIIENLDDKKKCFCCEKLEEKVDKPRDIEPKPDGNKLQVNDAELTSKISVDKGAAKKLKNSTEKRSSPVKGRTPRLPVSKPALPADNSKPLKKCASSTNIINKSSARASTRKASTGSPTKPQAKPQKSLSSVNMLNNKQLKTPRGSGGVRNVSPDKSLNPAFPATLNRGNISPIKSTTNPSSGNLSSLASGKTRGASPTKNVTRNAPNVSGNRKSPSPRGRAQQTSIKTAVPKPQSPAPSFYNLPPGSASKDRALPNCSQ